MLDARRAIQTKEVNALLVVIPLTGKYLSLVRDFFQQGGSKALPVLVPIDLAGATRKPNALTKASTCSKARCAGRRRFLKMT